MRTHWKNLVRLATLRSKPKSPYKIAKLKLIRHSSTCPDYDGLCSGFKAVIDGLTEAGIIEDDSMTHIGMPTFEWCKAKRGCGFVEVFVTETDKL